MDHSYLEYIIGYHSSLAVDPFPPRKRPVLLAAIRPTLRPAGVSLRTVDGLPIC